MEPVQIRSSRADPPGRRPGRLIAAVAVTAVLAACGAAPGPTRTPAATGRATVTSRSAAVTPAPAPGVPSFAHVVVVVEENKTPAEVLGSGQAPWLSALARSGASFDQSYAVAHPSEPNYLALFAGATFGLRDDACPTGPYSAPDLVTTLHQATKTFVGYAEGLPAAGSTVCSAGDYARKHAPWTDFPDAVAAGRPMTAFPADPSNLPDVAFVVPDLADDMHDGSVAAGDRWLQQHLGAYATWAAGHDSLLVVTFDEDDDSGPNRVVTVFAGAHVRTGAVTERIDHVRVLATVAAAVGAPAPGTAELAAPITSVWTP